MRTVFTAQSPAEAHLVAGLLEEEGIRAVVEGEMLFGVRGDIGLSAASLPMVCVTDEDFERARAVLEHRKPSDEVPKIHAEPDRRKPFDVAVLALLGICVAAVCMVFAIAMNYRIFVLATAVGVVALVVAIGRKRARSS